MKTAEQILNRIEEQADNLRFALQSSAEETTLKHRREGALAALEELRKFITDKRWEA